MRVRADAHVDVIALLIEGQGRILGQVADVLHLVVLAAIRHQPDGFLPGQREGLDGQILLDDLLHFLLDGGQILIGQLHITQIHVVVEALLGGGAVGKVGLRVEVLQRLGQDVGRAVTDDVQLVLRGTFADNAVVVDDLHGIHAS